MDLIQNFQNFTAECRSDVDSMVKKDCNSGLAATIESESSQSSFDCNICFDLARDPVVTLCGHLYCWACIFKWLHVQSSSSESTQQKTCPVCKANISQSSLIPLYCHGSSRAEDESGKSPEDVIIPPRPAAVNSPSGELLSNPFESQYPEFQHGSYASISPLNHVSPTMAGIINPTIELLGELVYTRRLGSTGTSSLGFPLPNSYASVRLNSNPRTRRQELHIAKSLNRMSIFLFACVFLCLLLF